MKTFIKIEQDFTKIAQELGQKFANNIARKAMRFVLAIMRTDVRAKLPSSTGSLIKSETSKVSIKRNKVTGMVGSRKNYASKREQGDKSTTTPPTTAQYAPTVEGGRKQLRPVKKKVMSDGTKIIGTKVKALGGKHTFRDLQAEKSDQYAATFTKKCEELIAQTLPKT